jgi:predicted metal-binding membrane protein
MLGTAATGGTDGLASPRGGYGGTLRMGLAHALYCVGCCWGLMAVLVAAGHRSVRRA